MMRMTIWAMAIAAVVGGCAAPGHVTLVTWRDYLGIGRSSDPNEAVYIVDGREVGKGREGLRVVIARLKTLPVGSEVYLYPYEQCRPPDAHLDPMRGYGQPRFMPFELMADMHYELRRAVLRRHLSAWAAWRPPATDARRNDPAVRARTRRILFPSSVFIDDMGEYPSRVWRYLRMSEPKKPGS